MSTQTTRTTRRRGALMAGVAAALAISLSAQNAYADVNLTFPGESPGVPAYARIDPDVVLHTEEWAVVPFYRLPTCVPVDFNLMSFFDVPRSFGCAMTVEGHEVWENGPGQEPAPKLATTHGSGVPVYVVSWPELQGAMGDGVLTIGELSSLDSLMVGTADRYQEVLRPGELLVINARGTLSDGRSSRFHAKYSVHGESPQVQIDID